MGKIFQIFLLTALLAVPILTAGTVHADHETKKHKSKNHALTERDSLDRFARKIKKNNGRLLKFIRDDSGNIRAKVLTKDGRVKYLSIDSNGD